MNARTVIAQTVGIKLKGILRLLKVIAARSYGSPMGIWFIGEFVHGGISLRPRVMTITGAG
jgi:hypothetical protein